jgi:hypothetical protein
VNVTDRFFGFTSSVGTGSVGTGWQQLPIGLGFLNKFLKKPLIKFLAGFLFKKPLIKFLAGFLFKKPLVTYILTQNFKPTYQPLPMHLI